MSRARPASPPGRMTGARATVGAAVAALTLALVLGARLAVPAAAADPTATAGAGGDPRSSGQGPGLVGDPLLAIGSVVLVGLGSVVLTLGYVRLTQRRRA